MASTESISLGVTTKMKMNGEKKNQKLCSLRYNLVSGRNNSTKFCPLPDHITKQTMRGKVLLRNIFTLKGAKNGLDLLTALLEASVQFLVISSLSPDWLATGEAEGKGEATPLC